MNVESAGGRAMHRQEAALHAGGKKMAREASTGPSVRWQCCSVQVTGCQSHAYDTRAPSNRCNNSHSLPNHTLLRTGSGGQL